MIYLHPYISFGAVDLEHYNLWVYKLRSEGFYAKKQKFAYGIGLGLNYRFQMVNIGFSLGILTSSAISEGSYDNIYRRIRHSLNNFLINIPIGINYPISKKFSIYVGTKPIFGYSSLSWYDSLHINIWYDSLIINFWGFERASLSASSFGIGFEMGGDVLLSKPLALSVRFGYDVLNFEKYDGESEVRGFDGSYKRKLVFLIFDRKDNELKLKDKLPDFSKGEVWGEENLSSFRFSVGLKIGLGR